MKTEIKYGSLRRGINFHHLFNLSMGRNSPAAAPGHHGAESGKCRCGLPFGHEGFYVDFHYACASFDLGWWRLFKLYTWVNNEGHGGSYFSIAQRWTLGIFGRSELGRSCNTPAKDYWWGPSIRRAEPY